MPELASESLHLLGILECLGGVNVPRMLFERFLNPQRRWDENGYIFNEAFDGYSEIPLGYLFEEARLTTCLDDLLLRSLISVDNGSKSSFSTYSIPETAREYTTSLLRPESLRYWTLLALQLVCHVFPRDPTLDPK